MTCEDDYLFIKRIQPIFEKSRYYQQFFLMEKGKSEAKNAFIRGCKK